MLPDHLTHGLSMVCCGTAAGRTSAVRGQYHARKGNRFWGLLAEAGLTRGVLRPVYDHLLPGYGIELTIWRRGWLVWTSIFQKRPLCRGG